MKTRAALLLLVTIAFGLAPFVTPPFTGYDPALFPVQIAEPAIQPAGYAFSIWGLIYLWLILHAGLGLFRHADSLAWDAPRWPLILSVALGAAWLSIAPVAPILATVTIWIMALAAIAALLRADTETDRWLLSAPIAILAGWLTAAASVSTGVVLSGYGLLPDTGSAAVMLAVTLGLALWTQAQKPRMPVYGLTVIWALIGVTVKNAGVNPTVAILAGLGIALVAFTLRPRRHA
ncbi:hypothetical protein [Paragemmobacter ruber]|uniref:Seryl-tRNA synthetase n=1 Tax=Paragemmobacter ruber TaxID=1985673 RepID=A0ABW9Y8H9_9RHOB|nr:hypothetical protein [Rhodobacter ruber]NBE08733.1 hypothetical protein [Rhodobacter ruber]